MTRLPCYFPGFWGYLHRAEENHPDHPGVRGQGLHVHLHPGDAAQVVCVRLRQVLHQRLVLAGFPHRGCMYPLLISGWKTKREVEKRRGNVFSGEMSSPNRVVNEDLVSGICVFPKQGWNPWALWVLLVFPLQFLPQRHFSSAEKVISKGSAHRLSCWMVLTVRALVQVRYSSVTPSVINYLHY